MKHIPTNITPAFVLFLTFLVLKLTHVINWSWWWIASPFWGIFAIFFILGLCIFGVPLLASALFAGVVKLVQWVRSLRKP